MKGDDYSADELSIGSEADFWKAVGTTDQVICGYNKTRHEVNRLVREQRGFVGVMPVVGDRVICLQNNRTFGVFNGLMGTITKIRDMSNFTVFADVVDDLGRTLSAVPMDRRQYGADVIAYESRRSGITYWDYGYCVTAHKAQGSQWDSVLVKEEMHPNWEASRWRYTAATRAAKTLRYCR